MIPQPSILTLMRPRSTLPNAGKTWQTGLTLIELLISLVILGFVVTIMSGAFFQVGQVVRVAENVNGQFQPQWVRLNALKDVVANLVLPENVEHPFTGDSRSFDSYSLSLPQGDWGTVQAFKVKLEDRPQGGTDLLLGAGDEKAVVVASWDIPVQLEYLMVDGSAESMWPPLGKKVEDLPRGVVLRASSGERLVQMIATYDGQRKVEANAKNDMGKLLGVDVK